jgi:threonine/homoserine/homoserine lactone efflux protein
MIEPHKFHLFLVAAFLLSISPGPGMIYVLARTLQGGRPEGLASTLGTAVGGLAHVLAATLGLSAIIMRSALVYGILKYVGAAYLVFLGCKALLASRRPLELGAVSVANKRHPFRQGVLTEALNPKTAVFFFTFLPQFVNPGDQVAAQLLLLGTISVALNSLADVAVALFAAPLARGMATNPNLRRNQQGFCGLTLIGLGGFVAVSGDK